MKRIAIMQPTYLPWSGYIGLMKTVDIFVILDCVQFAKRSWQQRNQIKTIQGPLWLTVPVETKGKRDQLINEVNIKQESDYINNHSKAIEYNYKKARYFNNHYERLTDIFSPKYKKLIDLNMAFIYYLSEQAGISCEFVFSSKLNVVGSRDILLAAICKELEADEYISPPGSRCYLEESKHFQDINVPIKYFEFNHPNYDQVNGEFLSHMSFIDMLFCCGKAKSIELIDRCSSIQET